VTATGPGPEPGSEPTPGRRDGRLTALDGIRAFAVLGVMLFHFGVPWAQGGLLGVDVFFVLSGFLITSLLCREFDRTSTVRLRAFWARRARRLLPGLFVLLLAVALYAHFYATSVDVTSLRKDALATLLYVANWRYIVSNQGYFAMGQAPSALLHTWTLGIEEQYYVVWPLVAVLVLRWRGPRGLAVVAGVGALASAVEMVVLYAAGFSVNRLYYGTDTRAQALLVGSFLAAVGATAAGTGRRRDRRGDWRALPASWTGTVGRRRLVTLAGVAGAVVLLAMAHSLVGTDPLLYRGGFFVVALSAGAVITAVVTGPSTLLARFLSLPPLVYVGRISYGLYLYHWPLFLALDNAHTGLTGLALLTVRMASTFLVAGLSFHYVEEPIRRGRLAQSWRGLAVAVGGAVATAAVVVAATVPVAFAGVPAAIPKGSTGLSMSQRQALVTANAFTTDPVRFILFGDSVAYTASVGLQKNVTRRYGIKLYNGGVLGCDLDSTPMLLNGAVNTEDNCGSWQKGWSKDIAEIHPEVDGLLIGRYELADHFYHGHWMHVGQPVWDRQLKLELDEAVTVLSAGGAHVALFTFPYIDPATEELNGSLYPENQPSRVDEWNRLLGQVAASHPQTVTLIDLNRILDPDGHYTTSVDGLTVRRPDDGIHLTTAGGEWLQPRLLPEIGELGLQARSKMP